MTGPSQALAPDHCRCPRATPPVGTERQAQGLFGISVCYTQNELFVCTFLPVSVEWLCIFMWACSEQRQKAQLEHWPKTNYRLCTCSGKLCKTCLKRLSIQYVYDSLWLSFIFSRRETNPNSVFIVIVKITLMLLCTTCLCRLSLSISERTHPTLPSPPHTKIRKLSNFWNRRKLEKTQQSHSCTYSAGSAFN